MKTTLEISARHIHFSVEDFYVLFRLDSMSIRNYLDSENHAYATRHTVEIVGPEGRMHNVRVLGPFRQKSQLELSRTDAIVLDIDAPLTISGSGLGAKVRVIGPKGEITKNIAMVAQRHWHLSPEIAQKKNIVNGSKFNIKVSGQRALIFENVIVRIKAGFQNHVHLDTDEGNAAGIGKTSPGEVELK